MSGNWIRSIQKPSNSPSSLSLVQLHITIFMYYFSTLMVIPATTDTTMSAVCPEKFECSIAIYLTGLQQAMTGLGTFVMMPLVGNLSDRYGRKALLTLPMALNVIPFATLAFSRTTTFFYTYYVLKTLVDMICQGSVLCLSLAYVADNIPEERRASAFGILTGISSCAFVSGNIAARFLSTPSTFQVAASVAAIAAVYMRIFLPESLADDKLSTPLLSVGKEEKPSNVAGTSSRNAQMFKRMPSLQNMISLLKSSSILTQAAVVAFCSNLADVGFHASMNYYLKAKFQFNKDQFADIMVISGIGGTISQLIVLPILTPVMGEEKLLAIGLFFNTAQLFLFSIAWSSWVPYLACSSAVFSVLSHPCVRTIVSKQVGPFEQGKTQGCISGVSSIANVVSPLTFSPVTALFLSDSAPFNFPGFGIMCTGFASMIALFQSLMIRAAPPIDRKSSNCNHAEA